MAEGGVEDEQRDVEEPGLHLVPFEDRPADVVAADEHVGPGETADGTTVDRSAGDIRAGIGAQVARIPHRLGLPAEIGPHLGSPRSSPRGSPDRRGSHPSRSEAPPGPPLVIQATFFPDCSGGLRLDIVGRHDLLHPRRPP